MKAPSVSRATVRWIVASTLAAASVAVIAACRGACGTVRNPEGRHPVHAALKKLRCHSAEARLERLQQRNPGVDSALQPGIPVGNWDRFASLK